MSFFDHLTKALGELFHPWSFPRDTQVSPTLMRRAIPWRGSRNGRGFYFSWAP